MFFCPLVGRVVIRFPDEELELEEDEELELDELELELDEDELELEELELDELELLEDDEVELDELLEAEPDVPPQPEITAESKNANEPRATPLGNMDFGKALIVRYLNKSY